MWLRPARTVVMLASLLLFACGGRSPEPDPDGGTTGAGGTAGSGGSGGAAGKDAGGQPYLANAKGKKLLKVDLLFMIDNSSSMADKQAVLSMAIPELVDRLIDPKCVDPATGRVLGQAINGVCAAGTLDFEPVKDIHVGVVTSSLGNHGAGGICEDAIDISIGRSDPHNNDQGRLVSRGVGGTNVPTYLNKGFLNYNPSLPGGLSTSAAVSVPFADMVKGVGQHGCGYEASLEAVYRFLVDPEPYATIRIDTSIGGFGQALLNGTDMQLLQQRADFLRADSLVAVVLVTDENDCSIVDGGQGFYALLPPVPGTGKSVLKHGTSKCLENPNDKCCFNCGVQSPPAGCAAPTSDPLCQAGELLIAEDQPNIRCFDQKRRYGVDFLYPVQRYIDGFTKPQVPNRKGEMVRNPLYSDLSCGATPCASSRDPSHVVVTGLVGVPWQVIANDPSNLELGYKTARQIDDDGVWLNIVGDPSNPAGPVPPRDMHMVESIKPRNGLPGPASAPNADPFNGHEWDPSKDLAQPNADLQYACIFNLTPPRICNEAADCDCFGPNVADVQNPLCQNAQGAYTTTQLRAKAYPGQRILQVLRGLGDRAVVGSICPSQTSDRMRDDFGYSPFVKAFMRRVRQPLRPQCLPVALPVDGTRGQTPCTVIEAFNSSTCDCDREPGRRSAQASLITYDIQMAGNCFCEIMQLAGPAQETCRSTLNPPSSSDGWCYVDPAQLAGTCDVVRDCPVDQQRRIQFININSEPRPGAFAFLRCEAQPIAALPSRCP